jgi:DNA-binding NarL/FixJ family response regulator
MGEANSCRILLVDDNPSVHESVRALVAGSSIFLVSDGALDGREAVDKVHAHTPDLVLMDISMPRRSGIEATREIRRFNEGVPILFHSAHPEFAELGLAAGGNGFVTKAASALTFFCALRATLTGGVFLDALPWEKLKGRLCFHKRAEEVLNEEERQIAVHLLRGRTSKEIAGLLEKSSKRVEKVRARMMSNLGARNATALALKLSLYFPEFRVE